MRIESENIELNGLEPSDAELRHFETLEAILLSEQIEFCEAQELLRANPRFHAWYVRRAKSRQESHPIDQWQMNTVPH